MRGGFTKIIAAVILAISIVGCSGTNNVSPEIKPPNPFASAYLVPACGALGGAMEFYFAKGPGESATHRATYIHITADGEMPESNGNFIIMPHDYRLAASRCQLAGQCEEATWGTLHVRAFKIGLGASGSYELGFRDGSVEKASFGAAYREPGRMLICM